MPTQTEFMAGVQAVVTASNALPSLQAAKAASDQAVNNAMQQQATDVANMNSGVAAEQQAVKALEALAEAITANGFDPEPAPAPAPASAPAAS